MRYGRYAAALAERGHRVIGVDSSPEMLERARERVPSGEFRAGDLHRLPVADDAVDLVVCALALTHPAGAGVGPPIGFAPVVLGPGVYYDREEDLAILTRMFYRIWELSLSRSDSRDFIETILKESSP